jgi:DNA invertase Pin-like site-specific DNA recombinase
MSNKLLQRLRFAALIRVSTERQEQQGESLRTQRHGIERDVASLGGTIATWYGGQEHATSQWEHKEVDRLVADAKQGLFDCIIVSYADRWSRDNKSSKAGLEVFRAHGIKFYVGAQQMDLFDPNASFVLGLHAEVGEYIALQQSKKSLESRIARARRGHPTCGKLPWGRRFNRETEQWEVIPERQRLIQDLAQRYLAGESLEGLAKLHGMCLKTLWTTLMQRSGAIWIQEFRCERLAIHEEVPTTIPELLPPETIRDLHAQARANKTYLHGNIKNQYLLSRMIFCAGCGKAMCGHGRDRRTGSPRVYRHGFAKRQASPCPCPCKMVDADSLERSVLVELFRLFGNPAAVQRAVEAATPDRAKVDGYRHRLSLVGKELEDLGTSRDRVIRFISKGSITEEQADKQLGELKDREALLQKELHRLNQELAHTPTAEEVCDAAERVSKAFNKARQWAMKQTINSDFDGMTWDDKKSLFQMVFSGTTPDGRRMGVYVEPSGESGSLALRRHPYRILGRLIDFQGYTGDVDTPEGGGLWQRHLLRDATRFPSR